MEVVPVMLLATGAAALLVVISGVRASRRNRANRWLVGCMGAALVIGAAFRLATTAAPQAPLTRAQVSAFVYLRCEVLLRPFSADPDGTLGPQEQRPFWNGYATSLVSLAAELEPLDVEPAVLPAVEELRSALTARAGSVEEEFRAYAGGTSQQIAQAQAAGVAREQEVDAALDDLDLPLCASY